MRAMKLRGVWLAVVALGCSEAAEVEGEASVERQALLLCTDIPPHTQATLTPDGSAYKTSPNNYASLPCGRWVLDLHLQPSAPLPEGHVEAFHGVIRDWGLQQPASDDVEHCEEYVERVSYFRNSEQLLPDGTYTQLVWQTAQGGGTRRGTLVKHFDAQGNFSWRCTVKRDEGYLDMPPSYLKCVGKQCYGIRVVTTAYNAATGTRYPFAVYAGPFAQPYDGAGAAEWQGR